MTERKPTLGKYVAYPERPEMQEAWEHGRKSTLDELRAIFKTEDDGSYKGLVNVAIAVEQYLESNPDR